MSIYHVSTLDGRTLMVIDYFAGAEDEPLDLNAMRDTAFRHAREAGCDVILDTFHGRYRTRNVDGVLQLEEYNDSSEEG